MADLWEDALPRRRRTALVISGGGARAAYQVGVSQARVSLVRAGLLYHTDDDILRMAGRFRRETEVFRARRDSGSGRSGY